MTMDCYLRLVTTLMGMTVVDTFCLCKFYNFLPHGRFGNIVTDADDDFEGTNEITMKKFAGILAQQLLYKAYNLMDGKSFTLFDEDKMTEPLAQSTSFVIDGSTGRCGVVEATSIESCRTNGSATPTSPAFVCESGRYTVGDVGYHGFRSYHDTSSVSIGHVTSVGSVRTNLSTNTGGVVDINTLEGNDVLDGSSEEDEDLDLTHDRLLKARKKAIEIIKDLNWQKHSAVKLPTTISQGGATKGKKYVKPRQCYLCGELSRVKCLECNKVFCYPIKDRSGLKNCCFHKHVNRINKKGNKRRKILGGAKS